MSNNQKVPSGSLAVDYTVRGGGNSRLAKSTSAADLQWGLAKLSHFLAAWDSSTDQQEHAASFHPPHIVKPSHWSAQGLRVILCSGGRELRAPGLRVILCSRGRGLGALGLRVILCSGGRELGHCDPQLGSQAGSYMRSCPQSERTNK